MAESLAADSCVLRMGHIDSPDEFLAFELASSSHASSRGFALSRFCRGLGGLSSEAYPNMQMQGKGKKSTRFTFFAYVARDDHFGGSMVCAGDGGIFGDGHRRHGMWDAVEFDMG